MAMVSSAGSEKTTDEIKALKAQIDEYDRSHKEWLKGRNIVQLEASAVAKVETAKAEAAAIIESARSRIEQIERDRSQAAVLMAAAESDREEATKERKIAESARLAAQADFNKASAAKNAANVELENLLKKQGACDKRMANIQVALQKLLNE